MTHDVFLSYASEDRARVQKLYRRLRQAGLSCWMDKPPRPWQHDGIGPGQDWDTVIRRRLSDARVVLALLSQASVAKRGYVQREFRLALQAAAERPPNTIAVIPVLMEECQPPEFKVDTISFQQIHWYELHKDGVADLVQYVRRAVGWQPPLTANQTRQVQSTAGRPHMTPVLDFVASLDIPNNTDWRNKPLELFNRALTLVRAGDFEAANEQLRPVQIKNERRAVRALGYVTDRHVAALGMMMLFGYIPGGRGKVSRKELANLESHPIPEIRLLATAVLTDRGTGPAKLLRLLREYGDSTDRLLGFHDVLRWHVRFDSILPLASTHPRLVWELIANNPQFSMKGMRFMPMMDEGKQLSALASSTPWETREIGAGIHCADATVPLDARLRFLADEEPRVRFRALEGMLMDHHEKDITPILTVLKANPTAKNETRTWTVKRLPGVPLLWVVYLDDSASLPTPLTNGFAHGSLWHVVEAGDIPHCRLSGVAAIMPDGKDIEPDHNRIEGMLIARAKGVNRHWIFDILQQRRT